MRFARGSWMRSSGCGWKWPRNRDVLRLIPNGISFSRIILGLAFPWTATYTLKTVLERVRFLGAIDFARVGQRAVVGDPAGDGLAGALGVELGL